MFRPDHPERGLVTLKLSSTPDDPSRAVLEGLRTLTVASDHGELCHATTVATNSLLEGDLAEVGFLTTTGFADNLWIGRGDRPDLFALRPQRRNPPLDPHHVWEVTERVGAGGEVQIQLPPKAELETLIQSVKKVAGEDGILAFAVCLFHAPLCPEHEESLGETLHSLGLPVFLSHRVSPTSGEYERGMTTLLAAALAPKISTYLGQLERALGANPLWVVHSSGGLLKPKEARAAPHRLALSGPAAGLRGAMSLGESCGHPNLITLDMGGTSTDVALCHQGELPYLWETDIEGLPLRAPTLEIHTIGAGGGSIAHKDGGGFLRVGPRSAGAEPGPACYQRGGTQATVTDALCWAGYLPETLGDAELVMAREDAQSVLESLGNDLGLDVDETALGILAVAVGHLGLAVRKVSTGRGYDPKNFTLLPFGGAGPILCCAVADALEMAHILVPRSAGVLSAWGALVAPWEREWSANVPASGRCDESVWRRQLHELRSQIAEETGPDTEPGTGLTDSMMELVARRYQGQGETLVSSPEVDFHQLHQDRFGFDRAEHLVETVEVRWRCRGTPRQLPKVATGDGDRARWSQGPKSHSLLLPKGGRIEVPTFVGQLALGQSQKGPFLWFNSSSTLYVSAAWEALGQASGDLLLRRIEIRVTQTTRESQATSRPTRSAARSGYGLSTLET